MSMNVGLNLVEVDGKATPALQGAATSVAGFVIRSARGINGVVRQVTSWNQFIQYFGSYLADGSIGAYAIRGFLDNGGTLAYVTRVVGSSATPATHDFAGTGGTTPPTALTLTAAFRGTADPGAWGDDLTAAIVTDPDDSTLFAIIVKYKGNVVETWPKLKVGGTGKQNPSFLNDPFAGSGYVMVTIPATPAGNPASTGADTQGNPTFVSFGTTGADDGLTGAALQNAFTATIKSAFDTTDIQLLACPETTDPGVVAAALTYCQQRGDCMFVGHVPDNLDVPGVKNYVKSNNLQGDKVYGALYFPYILIADPIGTQKYIPPTGHVMGVYARTDRERGVWKAPAGNAAKVNNALGVRTQITDVQHTDLVKNGSVNAVRAISGQGIIVDSSRTLSTNTLWLYVNVRLLFNFVKSSLKSGLRWTVQEPNDPSLWNKVKFNSVTPFLMGLWRRGAFGPGAPADVFTVKIDADNNPRPTFNKGFSISKCTSTRRGRRRRSSLPSGSKRAARRPARADGRKD
jgi:phage tail sheath protein FI